MDATLRWAFIQTQLVSYRCYVGTGISKYSVLSKVIVAFNIVDPEGIHVPVQLTYNFED